MSFETALNLPVKPIYLLADSQLLFWKEAETSFLESVRAHIRSEEPKAAYIGASNQDDPQYYAIFEAAMDAMGIRDRRMILSRYSVMDELYINGADLILLAGGNVARGWGVFVATGIRESLIQRYYGGAILMGVSAGAVQLGLKGWRGDRPEGGEDLFDTFKLIPHIVDVHDEGNDWKRLRELVQAAGPHVKGMGIPKGGGLVYYPDHTLEPIRHPVYEFSLVENDLRVSLLMPSEGEVTSETDEVAEPATGG